MEFQRYITAFDDEGKEMSTRLGRKISPEVYYPDRVEQEDRRKDPEDLITTLTAERVLFANGRPYFKIWSDYVVPLTQTHLDIPAKYVKLPYSSFEVRLAEPLEMRGDFFRAMMVFDFDAIYSGPEYDQVSIRRQVDRLHRKLLRLNPATPLVEKPRSLVVQLHGHDGEKKRLAASMALPMFDSLSIIDSLRTMYDDEYLKDEQFLKIARLVITLSFLISGQDRLIEPDVLAADLDKFRHTDKPAEIERLHERATNRRGEGKGYTVGRRERLLATAQQRNDEYEAGTGRKLQYQHQRCAHLHRFKTKDGYSIKWIPQLTVRPELPLSPQLERGVQVR